jgi:hypothetical protein
MAYQIVKVNDIEWIDSFRIVIPFGITASQASHLIKGEIKAWSRGYYRSTVKRLVYVIKVFGPMALRYPEGVSSTVYIGEGNPINRLSVGHLGWLSTLASSINQVGIQIDIALPRRKNFIQFYKHIEADLIGLFFKKFGALPLANRQHEVKYQRDRTGLEYEKEVLQRFEHQISLGRGAKIRWTLIPWKANKEVYKNYLAGIKEKTSIRL